MMWSRLREDTDVQTMIDILGCDIRQFDIIDDEDLDTRVDFVGDFGSEYTCT